MSEQTEVGTPAKAQSLRNRRTRIAIAAGLAVIATWTVLAGQVESLTQLVGLTAFTSTNSLAAVGVGTKLTCLFVTLASNQYAPTVSANYQATRAEPLTCK